MTIGAVGEVYDRVWRLDVAPARGIDVGTVRLVLMALASHLDRRKLARGDLSVWPSARRIGGMVGRHERQVLRVLDVLVERGVLELIRPGLRPGRNRRGRPPKYRLAVEQWRQVEPPRGSDTGVVAIGGFAMAPTPASDGSDTGVGNGDGSDTGVGAMGDGSDTGVTRTRPVVPGTRPVDENPAREPGARARARESVETDQPRSTSPGACVQLPGFAAVSIGVRPAAAPTDVTTCPSDVGGCGERIDSIDFARQHADGCQLAGLYPAAIRGRVGIARERARRDQRRAAIAAAASTPPLPPAESAAAS